MGIREIVDTLKTLGSSDPVYFDLPLPPSVNHMYRNVRGMTLKSRQYRKWIKDANLYFMLSGAKVKPIQGKVLIVLVVHSGLGWNVQRDLDNLLKPVQDWIKNRGLIPEDNSKHVTGCCSFFLTEPGSNQVRLEVILVPLGGK